jgi:predicted DNA binding CopG/RHH family protein
LGGEITTKTISLRLAESMLAELRQLANQRDVPYQSLIKTFLRERIDQEYHRVGDGISPYLHPG